jgi:hypothetical protein
MGQAVEEAKQAARVPAPTAEQLRASLRALQLGICAERERVMNPLYLLIALLLLTYAIWPSGWIMGVIAGVVLLVGFFKAALAK